MTSSLYLCNGHDFVPTQRRSKFSRQKKTNRFLGPFEPVANLLIFGSRKKKSMQNYRDRIQVLTEIAFLAKLLDQDQDIAKHF
jgi:hypothetical protein